MIRRDGIEKTPFFTADGIKKIFSPPLVTFFAVIPLILFNIKLPSFFMDTCKYMGNLDTPMLMLMIGTIIHSIGFKQIKLGRDLIQTFIGRFIITLLFVVVALKYVPVDELMGKVFIMQSSMPVMAQTVVSASVYECDYKFAASAVSLSTILSLFLIPVYMYLIG